MVRIDRASGFVPASSGKLGITRNTLVAGRPAPRGLAARISQAIVMSPEQVEAQDRLEQARAQLGALERNHGNLALLIGMGNANKALDEARASVALYQSMLAQGGVGR